MKWSPSFSLIPTSLHQRSVLVVLTTAFAITLVLAACGGGGGSSSASAAPSVPSTPDVPQNPPPMPTAQYSGATVQVALSAANVQTLIFKALNTLDVSNALASILIPLPKPANPVYQLAYGTPSGTATLEGRLQPDGTGWLTIQNTDLKQGSLEDNGLLIFQITHYDPSTSKYDATVEYSNMEFKEPGHDLIVNGMVEMTDINVLPGFGVSVDKMVINATFQDSVAGYSIYVPDLSFSYGQGIFTADRYFGEVAGTVFDNSLGALPLTSSGTIDVVMGSDSMISIYSGALTITGSGNATAQFNSLNAQLAYIGLDLTGSGNVQQIARFDLVSSQPDTITDPLGRQNPVSAIDQSVFAQLGQQTTLDAYFSHSPKGAYLTCQWNLKLVPPGSSIPTGITNGPSLSFIPDLPGDYLAILTVSDGTQTATDAHVVHVYPSDVSINYSNYSGVPLGGDVAAAVGQKVQLDGRDMDYLSQDGSFPWSLTKPPGSNIALVNPTSQSPYFIPDVPGYYLVTLGSGYLIVGAGVNLHYTPPALMEASSNSTQISPSGYGATGDLNGDGRPDIVYPYGAFGSSDGGIVELLQQPDGTFVSNAVSVGAATAVAILVDMNGDGKPDVIAAGFNALTDYALLQQPDGSLSSPITIADTGQYFALSTIGIGTTENFIQFNTQAGISGLTAYTYSPPDSFTSNFIGFGNYSDFLNVFPVLMGDVTGDGISDVIARGSYQSSPPSLIVIPGLANGTFGTPATYPFTASNFSGSSIAVGDLNGDGLNDVIAANWYNAAADIFYQQPNGTLGSAVRIVLPGAPVGIPVPVITDINGDGSKDLLTFYQTLGDGDSVGSCVPSDCSIGINLQASDGTLGTTYLYPFVSPPTFLGAQYPLIYVTDFDQDGLQDILLSSGVGDSSTGNYIMFQIPFN